MSKSLILNSESKTKAIALREAGMTYQQIADEMGLTSKNSASYLINKYRNVPEVEPGIIFVPTHKSKTQRIKEWEDEVSN